MSSDGASQGVMPERALGTILGDKDQPAEDEKVSPEEFEAKIRAASMEPDSYDGASLAIARVILEAVEKYPCLRDVPMESVYLTGKDGKVNYDKPAVHICPGMYDVLKNIFPDEACPERKVMEGLTGFMWGWAYNASGRGLGLAEQPSPAIIEI